eukprot:TRINITY_DN2971_c0_g1_i1.p1 TRINITY_DN2971_c0_g1~~TRINITY_DN2971_c0_g1_i1.p1  ORF type:complete len:1429 (+),score=439.81 TRINITY_DN2971_c0_g1_i1:80-4366(+)
MPVQGLEWCRVPLLLNTGARGGLAADGLDDVTCCEVTRSCIIVGSARGLVLVFDRQSGERLSAFTAPECLPAALALSPEGAPCVPRLTHLRADPAEGALAVAVEADSSPVVTAAPLSRADDRPQSPATGWALHSAAVAGVCWLGESVISGDAAGHVLALGPAGEARTLLREDAAVVQLESDGAVAVVSTLRRALVLRLPAPGEPPQVVPVGTLPRQGVYGACLLGDSVFAARPRKEAHCRLWVADAASGKVQLSLRFVAELPHADPAPDGIVLSGTRGGALDGTYSCAGGTAAARRWERGDGAELSDAQGLWVARAPQGDIALRSEEHGGRSPQAGLAWEEPCGGRGRWLQSAEVSVRSARPLSLSLSDPGGAGSPPAAQSAAARAAPTVPYLHAVATGLDDPRLLLAAWGDDGVMLLDPATGPSAGGRAPAVLRVARLRGLRHVAVHVDAGEAVIYALHKGKVREGALFLSAARVPVPDPGPPAPAPAGAAPPEAQPAPAPREPPAAEQPPERPAEGEHPAAPPQTGAPAGPAPQAAEPGPEARTPPASPPAPAAEEEGDGAPTTPPATDSPGATPSPAPLGSTAGSEGVPLSKRGRATSVRKVVRVVKVTKKRPEGAQSSDAADGSDGLTRRSSSTTLTQQRRSAKTRTLQPAAPGRSSAMLVSSSARPDFSQFLPDTNVALPEPQRVSLHCPSPPPPAAELPMPPQPPPDQESARTPPRTSPPPGAAEQPPPPSPRTAAALCARVGGAPPRGIPAVPPPRRPDRGGAGAAPPPDATAAAGPPRASSSGSPRDDSPVPLEELLGSSPLEEAGAAPAVRKQPPTPNSSSMPPPPRGRRGSLDEHSASSSPAAPARPAPSSPEAVLSPPCRPSAGSHASQVTAERVERFLSLTRDAHVKYRDIRFRQQQFGERQTERQLAVVFASLSVWADALLPIASEPELLQTPGGSEQDALRKQVAELTEFYLTTRLGHPNVRPRCLAGHLDADPAAAAAAVDPAGSLRRTDDDVAAQLLVFLRGRELLRRELVDTEAIVECCNTLGAATDNYLCAVYALDAIIPEPRLPLPRGYMPHPQTASAPAHLVEHLWRPVSARLRASLAQGIDSDLLRHDPDAVEGVRTRGRLSEALWYLPYLFSVATAKALHLCVSLYPKVGWKNVRMATGRGVQRAAHDALHMDFDAERELLFQDLYLDYLMTLSQTHSAVCKSQGFVTQYLAVLLHSIALLPVHHRRQQAIAAGGALQTPPGTPKGPDDHLQSKKLRRREDIITEIISNPGTYTYDAEEVAELFTKHAYYRGLLLLGRERQYIRTLLARNQLNLLFHYFQHEGRDREADWEFLLKQVYAMKREQDRAKRRGDSAQPTEAVPGVAGPLERVAYIMCVVLGARHAMDIIRQQLPEELEYDSVLQDVHKKLAILAQSPMPPGRLKPSEG